MRDKFEDAEVVKAVGLAWNAARDHAALHRGHWLAAPCFWAAFATFIHMGYGIAGFAIHAGLCLPRALAGKLCLLAAFPLLALWFAAREPHLSLPGAPFHRSFVADGAALVREGVVANEPVPSAMGHVFLFRERDGGRRLYRATVETPSPPPRGATIRLTGMAAPEAPPPNPGQLDMRRVLRAQGAAASLKATSWDELHPPPAWARALSTAREALRTSLARNVPPAALPLPEAALLNITENVPESTRDSFLRSGMQHVLAISGQHIGILIAFLLAFSRCVRLPRKAAFTVAALMTAAYIPLVGAPVSVVRSGITFACLLPAVLMERRTAGLHALCLTAAIDLLFDPHNILNLGFQLSYAATSALVVGTGPLQRAAVKICGGFGVRGAWPVGTAQMILLSALIALFTYPVLAASTHATTPWGILGNLAAAPVGAAMLVGGLFVWSFDFMLPAPLNRAAAWAGAVTGACALALEGCVSLLASLPGALRPIADAPNAWLALLAGGSAIIAALLRRDRFRAALLCAGGLVVLEANRPTFTRAISGEARVAFLAVGHGDAAVLELPGAVILVDAGDSPRIARNVIAPYLRHRGIARLDLVMISHAHLDHFGGLGALMDLVPVGRVLAPPDPEAPSASWRCLREKVRRAGVPWLAGARGDLAYAGNGGELRVLGPDETLAEHAEENDRSLVALLLAGRTKVLFTGDIEPAGQRALAATWPLWREAWLKAPHHGSDRTTLPCYPDAAAAPRAVISCGRRRGFPGARTMEALRRAGTETAITSRHGAVTWILGARGAREIRHLDPN